MKDIQQTDCQSKILQKLEENQAYLKALLRVLGDVHGIPSEKLDRLYREYLEETKAGAR